MTTVRPLKAADEAEWRRLWADYLTYYQTDLPEEVTSNLFWRLLKGEPHFAFVAERNGAVIGFVHGLPHASTWSMDKYCYLEDLFVDLAVRGTGAGRKLIEAVYTEADRRGCSRVYWHTEEGNAQARKLYDNLASLTNFVQYRR